MKKLLLVTLLLLTACAPRVSGDLHSYLTELSPILGTISDDLGRIGRLSTQLGDHPDLFTDAGWRRDVTDTLDSLKSAAGDLSSLEPVPPEARALDEYQDDIALEVHMTVAAYERFLDGDLDQVEIVADHMRRIGGLSRLATQEIERLQNSP